MITEPELPALLIQHEYPPAVLFCHDLCARLALITALSWPYPIQVVVSLLFIVFCIGGSIVYSIYNRKKGTPKDVVDGSLS